MMPDLQQINLADLRPKARLIPAEVIQVACQKRLVPSFSSSVSTELSFSSMPDALYQFPYQKTDRKSPNGNACVGISETISAPRAFSACTI